MQRRIFSLLLAFALFCGLLPQMGLTAQAATYSGYCGAEGDGSNLTWSLNTSTGTLTISGSGKMADYEWEIYVPWYDYFDMILTVSLPEGLTSIGDYAFKSCALTSVTIPDSVTSIGDYAFYNCSALTSVTIPDSVTSIGDYAFYNCSALTSVTIPDSVTSIGNCAFCGCSALTSVTIPDSVTIIGQGAFEDCSALTSVTIPDSVTSIGDYAFCNCSALASVTIPDSVTSIGQGAFFYCSALTSVTIPDSVTSIGERAFYNCSALTSVTIPDSVTSIGVDAFLDCSAMTTISVATDNPSYSSKDGVLFNKSQTELIQYPTGKPESSYVIPDSVTSIGDYAFKNCSALTSVTIPDSVTSIGQGAFFYCSALTSVTIPDSVTSIGAYAFLDCSALTSVTIPDSVTSIGVYAFIDCSALTSVTIPDSVTSIGNCAFCGCSALTSVTIGNGVTSIGAYAFYNCKALASVTIPASVTSIGERVFGYYSYYSENDHTWEKKRVEGFTIYGYPGTAAEEYAEEMIFQFVPLQDVNPFEDVQESDFFYNPVIWAVSTGVTAGRNDTHFAPDETVMRAEAVQFFWAAKGKPAYSTTKSPFKDVKKKHWYYGAVMWAVENKITSGTDETHFSPKQTCSRSEILQFLYAAMGKPGYSIDNPYSDVKTKHWYKDGAIWAYEQGLEKGENGKFKAKTPCTRAYVVTYLYRFITKQELLP